MINSEASAANERVSGILMHISSLSSDYGIGTLGSEAYAFADRRSVV